MTTHARLRLGAAALVALAIALLGGSHLCGVALDKAAADPGVRPIGASGLACTEFWLNRYQTLLGAFAALIAGYAAWRGAMTQVARADAQIALVNKQFSIDRVQYINDRLRPIHELYVNIEDSVSWLNFSIQKIPIMHQIAANISKSAKDEDWSHIKIFERQYQPELQDMMEAIRGVSKRLDAMHAAAGDATIPENMRQDLREVLYTLVKKYEETREASRKFETNIGIKSSFETIVREYDDIYARTSFIIEKIDLRELDMYNKVLDERAKLLALRTAAEAIAEA